MVISLVTEDNEEEDGDNGEELGGLFRVSQPASECKHKADSLDCSRFHVEAPHDWDLEEVRLNMNSIFDLQENSGIVLKDYVISKLPTCY